MVSVILSQFFPPSNGVPFSIDSASFGSKRCRSRVFLSSRAPGKPGGIMAWAGIAKPWLTLTTFSRSIAWATARRTLTVSKGGFGTCGKRDQVPGDGNRKTSSEVPGRSRERHLEREGVLGEDA